MARPLYEQIRNQREYLRISQSFAARCMGVSQSTICRIEQGEVDDKPLLRSYLAWLQKHEHRKRSRKPGRAPKPIDVKCRNVRGEVLLDERTCAKALPRDWVLLFLTRVSEESELGALYHPGTDAFGLTGFRKTHNGVTAGDIIRFESEYDGGAPSVGAYKALEAFCSDRLPDEIRRLYAPNDY